MNTHRSVQLSERLAPQEEQRDWQHGHRNQCSRSREDKRRMPNRRHRHRKCRPPGSGTRHCSRPAVVAPSQSTEVYRRPWAPDLTWHDHRSLQPVERQRVRSRRGAKRSHWNAQASSVAG
eukprot:1256934-Prymnesium_polylepis.1